MSSPLGRNTSFRQVAPLFALVLSLAVACSGTADVVFDDEGGAGSGAGSSSGANGTGAGTSKGGGGGNDPSCLCDAPSFPVCGVDGETYDAGCGRHCVPAEVACDGACPCQSCDEIAAEYRENVAAAKQCDAAIDVEQCTFMVLDGMPCGCNTFINPGNGDALAKLQELMQKWSQLGCDADILCEACEADPVGGLCTSDGGNARIDACQDVFAD